MEKNIEICLLLDFYGQLLTKRQEEILKLYFDDDLSLAEIADELGITRQGVHDNIKRAEKTLQDLESRLGIISRFKEHKKRINEALNHIKNAKKNIGEKAYSELKIVEEILNSIIDD
ncbi:MAG: putative DNA-binding protein [Deltaproteobacteria bacterium]